MPWQTHMADLPTYVHTCLHSCRLAVLAIMCSAGIVLQFLACALYKNWWPMLTATMYVMLPMPLLFFGPGDSSVISSTEGGGKILDWSFCNWEHCNTFYLKACRCYWTGSHVFGVCIPFCVWLYSILLFSHGC